MARSAGIDRARVIEVAAELADANGFEQLTLAQVAEKLGIRLPSLYNHVEGLAGLRRELALRGVGQLTEQIGQAAIGLAGADALRAILVAYRAYALAHPGVYVASVRAPAPGDTELIQAGDRALEIIRRSLTAFQFDEETQIHMIRGLRSVAHGFVMIELAGGFGMPLDRERSFAVLIDTYIAGIDQRKP